MLTERKIRDARAEPKARIIWDKQVVGLGLKVFPTGRKAFVLSYRVGRTKRLATLARAGECDLKGARELAGKELIRIRGGEADPLTRRTDRDSRRTVDEGLDRLFGEWAPERIRIGKNKASTIREYRLQADRYLRPALGKLAIEDVTRHHVEAMVRRLSNRPTQRNRVLAFTSRAFNLFEAWEYRDQHTNPVRGIDKAREAARDRTLSADEIQRLSVALAKVEGPDQPIVAAIKVAMLSGLRIGEVLGLQWSDVDLDTGRAKLRDTKTGDRWHDLPEAALDVIDGLGGTSEFVFVRIRDQRVTYWMVRKLFDRVCRDAGLVDLRLHDMRRTVATMAARSGAGSHVIRDLLGHRTTAMADRYIRFVGEPVRQAREKIGGEIASLMEC